MANQYKGIAYLRRKLAVKRERVLLRYKYYEQKDHHLPRNLLVPTELQNTFKAVLGWSSTAVDSMADCLSFRGFRNDNFNMQQIYEMNNPDVLFDSAILGALISSCDFIYISEDETGFPRLQVIDGANATGIIDPITNMLEEGYAVLKRDEYEKPTTEAYFIPGKTYIYTKDEKNPVVFSHYAPYPLLVPIIYRPDSRRPFGHSRLSRACMSAQNNANDTLLNMSICSEANSFPQKYVLGMDEDAENINEGHRAALSDFLQINRGSGGGVPTVGQFAQAQLSAYVEELETWAGIFAAECDLTTSDLGFHIENTSDADNYAISHSKLQNKAFKAQRNFGVGFLNAGYLAACVRDKYPYKRKQVYQTKVLWEPIFTPGASTIAAIGDAAVKVNQAVPGYFGDKNLRDLTGMDSDNSTGGSF